MAACAKEAFALYEEIAAGNPRFARIYASWKKFREEEYLWFRVAEQTFDNFVLSGAGQQQAKGG